MAITGALALTIGCESDSTAPKDNLPPLSAAGTATIAGQLAFYLNQAYGVYQDALGKSDKDTQIETFESGGVSGSFTMDFQLGGSPSPSNVADYVRAYTASGQQIEVRADPADENPLVVCTFDAEAFPYDNTEGSESGTVNGGGTIVSGAYTTTFTLVDAILSMDEYPPSGTMTYDGGANEAEVTFNGTVNAALVVGETDYTVNLDTGDVTEVTK